MTELPRLQDLVGEFQGKGTHNGCIVEWKGMKLTGFMTALLVFERYYNVTVSPSKAEGEIKEGSCISVWRRKDDYELLRVGHDEDAPLDQVSDEG